MLIFDVVLLIILAGFVFYGFFFGLIRTVGMLAGLLVGSWIASRFYLDVFSWFSKWWPGNPNIGKIVSFIVCFTIISHLVGWAFILFEQAFKVVTIVPFVKTINRLLGALFGFVEGALALGLILYVSARYVPEGLAIAKWLDSSVIAAFLISFSKILAPMLPEIYKKIKTII
jgi:membrane protein required for colicin V production